MHHKIPQTPHCIDTISYQKLTDSILDLSLLQILHVRKSHNTHIINHQSFYPNPKLTMDTLVGKIGDRISLEFSLGARSTWLFWIIVSFVIVGQLFMLFFGQHMGISVDMSRSKLGNAPADCMKTKTRVRGPLLQSHMVMLSPLHSRLLTQRASAERTVLACASTPASRSLARLVQNGGVTHALVQGSLLQITSATLPHNKNAMQDPRDIFSRAADELPKTTDELVLIKCGPYGYARKDTNAVLAEIYGKLVPIDVSTGRPPFLASLPSDEETAQEMGLVYVVIISWKWSDDEV